MFEYHIIKRRNQRNVRLSVREDGVVHISTPWRCPPGLVKDALKEHAAWLAASIEKIEAAKALKASALEQNTLRAMFLGEYYDISIRRSAMNYGVQWSEAGFDVEIPEGVDKHDEMELIATLFTDWYASKASKHLPPRIMSFAKKMQVQVNRITIRNQKTRWGSCSARGNLNFSLRLLMMPPEVIDYIIIHELAHLTELNHSPRFWAIVQRFDPYYKTHKAWLRKNAYAMAFP
jgi:predicted metal-dependent hydrolase